MTSLTPILNKPLLEKLAARLNQMNLRSDSELDRLSQLAADMDNDVPGFQSHGDFKLNSMVMQMRE